MTLFNLFKIFYSSLELYEFFLFVFYFLLTEPFTPSGPRPSAP